MSTVRQLLELAIDLGGDPDAINPYHKKAWEKGEHALGKNPAFPPHGGQGMNPHEAHAAGTYKSIIANLRRYGGHVPRNFSQQEVMRSAMDMFQTLEDVQQREADHQEELEQLAVETVMRLPEFTTLRRAVQSGQLRIKAYLNRRIDIQGMETSDQPQEELPGAEVEQIKGEYDEMIHKRKMINTIIQGAAISNNYSFAYYVRDELQAIDPTLINDYGKLMAYSELGYFLQSPEMVKMAASAGGSEAQGGEERLHTEPDGSTTIIARGISFPILVQEIIKGCMEYLSHNDEDDPETAALVNKHSDFVDDEQIQMQLGPNIYRQMIDAIGLDQAQVWPYLHDELVKMPTREFNQRMQSLIAGSPEGKRWFQELARKIKEEMGGAEEWQESLVDRLIGR